MTLDLSRIPRLQKQLIGHRQHFQRLVVQYENGTLHPAWLLSGPRGVGKATLAYKFARHILCSEDKNSAFYEALIDQNAHPNLFVLERCIDDDGKVDADIKIDKTRELYEFTRQSAAVPGWRVVIVDAIDELNRNAANSILKILEEPPEKLVFLMVCHSLGTILPTIRSRCCVLPISPLTDADFKDLGVAPPARLLTELSGGSVGTFLTLNALDVEAWLNRLIDACQGLMRGDTKLLTSLCGSLDKKNPCVEKLPDLITWLAGQLVLESSGFPCYNEVSDRVKTLSQSKPTKHWLDAQSAVTSLLNLSKGAHADPIHLIQAMLLILKNPKIHSD